MAPLLAASLVRDVPDFPKPGIVFKDITPILQDPDAYQEVIAEMTAWMLSRRIDAVAGIEARGFLFGAPAALALGVGFLPIRKLGKLPSNRISEEYALEYGTNTVEMHADAVRPGQRIVIADDVLATGGTAAASIRLIERLGGDVAGLCFLAELGFLSGREVLAGYDVHALLRYD